MKTRDIHPRANKLILNTAITLFLALVINIALVVFNAIAIFEHTQTIPQVPTIKDTYSGGVHTKEHVILDSQNVKQLSTDHIKNTYTDQRLINGEVVDSTYFNTNKVQDSKEGASAKDGKASAAASTVSRYAYNFVLGGIHENEPAYKGFLYNILISVNLLNKLGSEADFWVWAQLSPNSTLDEIPEEEMRLFDAMNIKVVKMEKPTYASFSSLMLDKFRALQKTEYTRLMYLDADLIPLVNLDYYFHLSDPDEKSVPTILQPNLNMATKRAPCNGGIFMMHPAVGAWEQLAGIVDRQHEEGLKLPYPHFDKSTRGWGHDFKKTGTVWESMQKKGHSWKFYGSHTDQGLWYYFSKYVRKDVSILIGDRLQTWVDENKKLPVKVKEEIGGLTKYTPEPLVPQFNCDSPEHNCPPQAGAVAHFMYNTKPWLVGTKSSWYRDPTNMDNLSAPTRLWFKELRELNDNLNIGLDIDNWNTKHAGIRRNPPLGFMAKPGENFNTFTSDRN